MSRKEKNKPDKLFGTDGIRSRVGQYPLDGESVVKLGRAIGQLIGNKQCKIVFGRDTRASGETIEQQLSTGIRHEAPETQLTTCGVIPTPGLAYVTQHGGFDFGLMITASHNPYTDNGIKIFGSNGEKIPDSTEAQMEEFFFSMEPIELPGGAVPGSTPDSEIRDLYHRFLLTHLNGVNETGFKVVLDCANGATCQAAPRIFRETGLDVLVTHAEPDGRNINLDCGSTHTDKLKEIVMAEGADIGIAFDGDGDRVLFTDNKGRRLDGDHYLYIMAKYFINTRDDFNRVVVGTVMGNLGLEKALERIGVEYVRTKVGDRHVYRMLKERQAILGGEQSGHVILKCFQKTGDGILSALYFLKALAALGMHPADVPGQLRIYPQELVNIDVTEKKDLETWDQLNQMIRAFNDNHGHNSRILIRYSGTEPKLRVMMESEDEGVIRDNIREFEQLVRSTIGS